MNKILQTVASASPSTICYAAPAMILIEMGPKGHDFTNFWIMEAGKNPAN